MGLFRKAGKQFEEAKRAILDASEVEYICTSCEKGVTEPYDECPYCGEATVVSVEDSPDEAE